MWISSPPGAAPVEYKPAPFAVPALALLAWLARRWPAESPNRLGALSTQAGVALLFITLIFPIQFEKQWLTVAWALEGVALLWLFHRVPHPGLPLVGVSVTVQVGPQRITVACDAPTIVEAPPSAAPTAAPDAAGHAAGQ